VVVPLLVRPREAGTCQQSTRRNQNPHATVNDFTITIDWGDGKPLRPMQIKAQR
jgi:hypothetical protein